MINGGHSRGISAVSNKGPQATWSEMEAVLVGQAQRKTAFSDYRKPTYMLVISKTSTTQSHLLLNHQYCMYVLYPYKDREERHGTTRCYLLSVPATLTGASLCPHEPGTDPCCSALISAICYCSPLARIDVKYQLFAECVPPSRSRVQPQGSGHKHSQGHALNSPLRAGSVRKAPGGGKDAHLNKTILRKGRQSFCPAPPTPRCSC